MISGPTQNYADAEVATRRARPALALAVRAAITLGPLALALVVGAVAALVLPPHRVGIPVWLWLVGVVATTSAVLFVCSRLLRRLAPLSALLRLSLVLPDDVPHRFALARRRWSPQALENSASAVDDDPSQRLLALVATLAAHDARTRAHGERVQAYAALIGRELGLPEADVERLSWAALLHDVGKVHVAPDIINKAGKPTEEEWAQIQGHPCYGGELVEPLRGWLGNWLDGVEQHHERFDGKGYPRRLAGQDISLAARIIAVADTYDVITSARAYKKPMTAEQARAEITRCAGEQFDPVVVRALLSVGIAKLRRVAGPATLLALLPVVIAAPAQAAPSVGAVLQAAGGQAATAVLAAGVGVTGGVASADVLAAPPGARVLVVQETSAVTDVTGGAITGNRAGKGPVGDDEGAATGPSSVDPASAGVGLLVPSEAPATAPTSAGATDPVAPGLVVLPTETTSTVTGSSTSASSSSSLPRSPEAPRSSAAPTPVTPARGAVPSVPSASSSAANRSSSAGGGSGGDTTKKAAQDAQQAAKDAEKAARDQADQVKAAQDAADKVAKQAAKDAQQAAEKAAKDQADTAKAAQDAANKAAKDAKDSADAAKAAADAAAKAAKQAADAAGRLTGGLTNGLTSGSTTGRTSTPTSSSSGSSSSPGASAAPSSGSSGGSGVGGGLVGGLLGGGR